MKRGLSVLLVLLLFSSVVSAAGLFEGGIWDEWLTGNQIFKFKPQPKTPPAPLPAACRDSDNGLTYDTPGMVISTTRTIFGKSRASILKDRCLTDTNLKEYYCDQNNRKSPSQSKVYKCSYGCEDGACKPEQNITNQPIQESNINKQYTIHPQIERLLYQPGIIQVVVNPEKNNIVLAIKFIQGLGEPDSHRLYISEDYGKTWIPKINLAKIEIDKVNPRIVYGYNENKIFRSEDHGKTFLHISTIQQELYLASIFSDRFVSGRIYIGHHNGENWGLYISSDWGNTFLFKHFNSSILVPSEDKEIVKNRVIWDIDQDPQNPLIIYTTSEQGTHVRYKKNEQGNFQHPHFDPYYIIRSQDGGITWEPLSDNLTWHSTSLEPYIDPQNYRTMWISVEEGPGTFLLDETLKKWSRISDHYGIGDYLINPRNRTIHFYLNSNQIEVTKNSGFTWNKLVENSNASYSSFSLSSREELYVSDFKEGVIRINVS